MTLQELARHAPQAAQHPPESAVRSGFLAAEAILREAGHARHIAQPPPRTTGMAGMARRLWPLTPGALP